MRVRQPGTRTKRETELAALEEAEARWLADRDRLAAQQADLVAEQAKLGQLAAATLLGEASEAELEDRREDVEGQLADVGREIATLDEATPHLKGRVAVARSAVLNERKDTSKQDWLATLVLRRAACQELAARIDSALEAAAKLEDARRLESTARAEFEEAARAEGSEPPALAGYMDEPEWSGRAQRLIDFISQGPLRPFSEQRTRNEKAAAAGQRRTQELIRWAVTAYKWNPAALDQVGPAVREKALRRIEAERERHREIRPEHQEQLAAQVGPGEVARGLHIDATD